MRSSESIRRNIQAKIAQLGWTQADLAQKCHMAPQALNRYLSGRATPGLDVLDRISAALGTTTARLISGDVVESKTQVVVPTLEEFGKFLARKIARLEALTAPLEKLDIERLSRGFERLERHVSELDRHAGYERPLKRRGLYGPCTVKNVDFPV